MLRLDIHVQSCSRVFEVLPEEVENAELMVEETVSHGLLTLFDEMNVVNVTVFFSSASHMGQRDCSIKIQAQSSYPSFSLLPPPQDYMNLHISRFIFSLL